jgi:hypothetical protein
MPDGRLSAVPIILGGQSALILARDVQLQLENARWSPRTRTFRSDPKGGQESCERIQADSNPWRVCLPGDFHQ